MRSYTTKKVPVFYREDGFYKLTLPQHAALSLAFHSALDRVGDPDDRIGNNDKWNEVIIDKALFRKRYAPILHMADADKTWQSKATVAESRLKPEEVFWAYSKTTIRRYLKWLRNYFSHYLHSPDSLREIADDATFMSFLQYLEIFARSQWLKNHAAWNTTQLRLNAEEKERKEFWEAMKSFSWKIIHTQLAMFEAKPPIPFAHLLLFLSLFISKGVMERLLKQLPPYKNKQEDATQGQKLRHETELFTALCLKESHDLHSQESEIIVALTILDHLRLRFLLQQEKKQNLLSSFNGSFFIKMLVAFIESRKILPNIQFARSFNGKPTFENECDDRELFISQNSVAILLPQTNNPQPVFAQIGIHALKTLVCAHLSGKSEIHTTLCNMLRPLAAILEKTNLPSNLEKVSYALPKTFSPSQNNEVTKTPDEVALALSERIQSICLRFFASNTPEHRKKIAILWWINHKLPLEFRFNKETYSKAFYALSTNAMALFCEILPNVSEKQCPFTGKRLKTFAHTNDWEKLYKRVESDFKAEVRLVFEDENTKELKPTATLQTIEELGKKVGLRITQKQQTMSLEEKWKNFQHRFHKHASIPARELWNRLDMQPQVKGKKQGRLPLMAFLQKYCEKNTVLVQSLYSHNKDTQKLSEREWEIYSNDTLLFCMAKHILNQAHKNTVIFSDDFTYTANYQVNVNGKSYSLEVNSAHARRSYVSLHPKRIENVIACYWKGEQTVPFVLEAMTERRENSPARSWLEADIDMERDRGLFIQAILSWEKNQLDEFAKQNTIELYNISGLLEKAISFLRLSEEAKFLSFENLCKLSRLNQNDMDEYTKFRNWALHQSPEQPFSTASGNLGVLFRKIQQESVEKRQKQKKAWQGNYKKRAN